MPLRFYDNNDWRSPTSVRVYDNGSWNDATVGYVYDLGVWRVVFPDPITPSISLTFGPYVTQSSVQISLSLINSDYIVVELFSGTTQSTLLQSQTIDTNNNITDSKSVIFQGLTGNTTYNIKVTSYSITNNTAVLLTGSFITNPSVSLTAAAFEDLSGAQVSWTTSRQSRWRVIIVRVSDSLQVYRSSLDLATGSTSTINAFFVASANTQYRVQLDIEYTGGGVATEYAFFTTPNVIQPILNSLSATSPSCSSITVNWNASNYVSGRVSLFSLFFDTTTDRLEFNTELYYYEFNSSTLSSRTFTNVITSTPEDPTTAYGVRLILESSTGDSLNSISISQYSNQPQIFTLPPSVNAPTNFSATSDYHGILASFSWTAATGNCTSVTGYRIEYKLNTSSTWSLISDSIPSNSTTWSAGGIGTSTFLPNRTYNFRIFAKSSFGNGPAATVNLTMNNNPYSISISGTNSIYTFSSSVLTAQLRNAAFENVSLSGFTISWSFIGGLNPPSGSSISPTSSITNTLGQASTTFTSSSDDGSGTLFATTNNLGPFEGGQRLITVNLLTGLTPILSGSGTNFGVRFNNNNHSTLYSYTNSSGYPTLGNLESGDSYNNSTFDILVNRDREERNTISKSGNTATTTNSTFYPNPSISMRITSSRVGYTSVQSNIASATASINITNRAYEWQQQLRGTTTWTSTFNNNFSGQNTKTLSWTSGINTRKIRCLVITTFSNGQVNTSTSLNELTIP